MGEVCVLLSYTDIHASIRGLEGANQETSICVYDTIIQPDLGDKKKHTELHHKEQGHVTTAAFA